MTIGDGAAADGERGRGYVRGQLARARAANIYHADEAGAFPDHTLDILFGESLLLVPDTCVLRQDVDQAIQHSRRGVLVAASNRGPFRLFCAEHVIEEVERQLPEWAEYQKRPVELYIDCWNREYLPLLRVVRGTGLPISVLSQAERARIDALAEPKEDLASISLALSLGAFYLTMDRRAYEAAHGHLASTVELNAWLPALFEGHRAGELGRFTSMSTWLTTGAIYGGIRGGMWLYKKHRWIFAALAAAGIGAITVAAVRIPRNELASRLATAKDRIGEAFVAYGREFVLPQQEAYDRFMERAPAILDWRKLEQVNSRDDVLARGALHYLARSTTGLLSAEELSKKLYPLSIGKSPQRVREVLRQHPTCFSQPYRGRWQVGHALTPVLTLPAS